MNKYIESETLELKEQYSKSIPKEIVSFLNAEGGTILIGIKDNGEVVGVDNVEETLRKISDIITTQIEPNPQDEIKSELIFDNSKVIISINIKKGKKHIYCQKKYGMSALGCTIRVGTTCREMTEEQIRVRYEKKFIDLEYILKKKSNLSDLTFKELMIYYSENGYNLDAKTFETNLNLRNDDGEYNLLAELLADKNDIPFMVVKFNGENKAAISERNDYGNGCIITTYQKIKNRLLSENICISDTTIRPRKDIYLFDFDAINEAILNAIVHNDWNIAEPQISIFSNRIEILSHGGLLRNMTKKEFFDGISKPRNKVLMRIFLNMGLTEHTGHGIPTIIEKYGKDVFEITDNYIKCVIPFDERVLSKKSNIETKIKLNNTEKKILEILISNLNVSSLELSEKVGVSKRTIERTLKKLQEKNIIEKDKFNKQINWKILNI